MQLLKDKPPNVESLWVFFVGNANFVASLTIAVKVYSQVSLAVGENSVLL